MRRRTRLLAGGSAVLALGAALSGCGIRATAVPVDAGAAPTRGTCVLPAAAPARAGTHRLNVQVYLVCGGRLFPVSRTLPRMGKGLRLAQVLLAELEQPPDAAEEKGGFASEMPGGLMVLPADGSDPASTWRLSEPPDSLPAYAVGQLVCTFAGALSGGTGHPVLLGGLDPKIAPRSYTCDEALRTNPDAGPTAGTPVG
ncbi:hypothetical protein [Streptantibioticus silvisoli]|uniref:Lipoprotein n=1 Tax=Streptantibioticus silvisoli TaxID=2705255 RepID=A0ABT6W9F5_9ACTN|nr:hypothetical protein [Streptantibioticus silvisoli]MDI5967370.1 hypothetical protein [Streptantibioticus silvisoli]